MNRQKLYAGLLGHKPINDAKKGSKENMGNFTKIFEGSGVKIEIDRERHLGAVIGSEKYRKEYVSSKVDNWVPK